MYWFNSFSLAAATEMEWNKEEEHPVPKSKMELNKIAIMEFNWLDYPDLAPTKNSDDLSIPTFGTDCQPNGATVVEDNSLAAAHASIAGTVDEDVDPC